MKHTLTKYGTLLALCICTNVEAKIKMPSFFADGMVLQQDCNAKLWGTAEANTTVKISASWDNKQIVSTHADKNGLWHAELKTPKATNTYTPYKITISDGEKLTIENVQIGEVWICSGQSNMEMPMEGFKGQPVEGAVNDLMTCEDNCLQLFTVKRASAFTPQDDVVGRWANTQAESLRSFSAAAYYFGRTLRRALNVPIGLIVTSWGGSSCEAWMAKEWLLEFPETQPENATEGNIYIVPKTEADIKSKNRTPTVLYNAMLHPLIGYTMRGIIWYQGEDNVPRYQSYARMLGRMISGWRTDWGMGDFPFYLCQIAPYDYSLINWKENSALLREQQQMVEKNVANTGMAVLMDAGLRYGIHPRKKREAGERLAMLALADTYNKKGLSKNARYESVEFRNDTAIIRFDRSRMWVYFDGETAQDNFQMAGADKKFYKAKAWASGNRVYVHCPQVKKPVAVRYAFCNWAEGDLFCDGLPISSFRTDDWDDAVDVSAGVEYDK